MSVDLTCIMRPSTLSTCTAFASVQGGTYTNVRHSISCARNCSADRVALHITSPSSCRRHCSACPIPYKLYCGRASMDKKPGSWHFRTSALQFLAQKRCKMPVRVNSPGCEQPVSPVAPRQHHKWSSRLRLLDVYDAFD